MIMYTLLSMAYGLFKLFWLTHVQTEAATRGSEPGALLKKRLWHRCLPVNFVKFLRTPFIQKFCEISRNTFYTEHLWTTASSQIVKLVVMANVFAKPKLKLNGSYSLNMSSLNSFATAKTNVFIVHANHEDLSLHKLILCFHYIVSLFGPIRNDPSRFAVQWKQKCCWIDLTSFLFPTGAIR